MYYVKLFSNTVIAEIDSTFYHCALFILESLEASYQFNKGTRNISFSKSVKWKTFATAGSWSSEVVVTSIIYLLS